MAGLLPKTHHRLDFDGLDLTGRVTYGSGYRFSAWAEGSTFGNPVPITHEVMTGLLYGTVVHRSGFGNRSPSFQIWVEADNSRVLADGEHDLGSRMADGRNPASGKVLGYRPPDGFGARTEYQVVASDLQHLFDDLEERRGVRRAFRIEMTALPFGYSAFEVVTDAIAAVAGAPTTVVISDGTDDTDWTGVSEDGGALLFDAPTLVGAPTGSTMALWSCEAAVTLDPAVDFTATPFVTTVLSAEPGAVIYAPIGLRPNWTGAGFLMSDFVQVEAGKWAVTWQINPLAHESNYDAVVRLDFAFEVRNSKAPSAPPVAPSVWIDDVERSNAGAGIPSTSATKQLTTPGAAPAVGSLEIAVPNPAATDTLGDVLVYTAEVLDAAGYVPNATHFLSSGSPGSGSWYADFPVSCLPPGTYALLAYAETGPTGPFSVGFQLRTMRGTITNLSDEQGLALTLGAGETMAGIQHIGTIELPQVDVPALASDAFVRLTCPDTVNEAWLLWQGDGAVTSLIRAGAVDRLWLDHPVLGDTTPGVFVGNAADRSDARYPMDPATGESLVVAWGQHQVKPSTLVHLATTGVEGATLRFRHRPAHLHFAVSVDGYDDPDDET